MMSDAVITTRNLTKSFGQGRTSVLAVDDISLDIFPAEIVLVMGPSGSGKTTLLSMLGGLLKPTKGTIEISGVDITAIKASALPAIRALEIGFIFQTFNLLDALSVEENILFPAQLHPGGIPEARGRANELISRLGLDKRRRALPQTLSGGEKQRVAIARALINQPKVILADEPTGNLDSRSGQEVMMILHDMVHEQGYSVVLVSHDPRVEDIADRILWLEDGKLSSRNEERHKWRKDPVCGMQVDEWTTELIAENLDKQYYFCSEKCLRQFNKTPEQYIK